MNNLLDHEGQAASDKRTGPRLARTRHQSWYALVRLDVRDRSIKFPNIPFEMNLVRLRPRENPRAPELRLVDDEEVQDACQVLDLIRTVVKNTNPCKAC